MKELCICVPISDKTKAAPVLLNNLLSSIEGETQKNCEVVLLMDGCGEKIIDEAKEKAPYAIMHINKGHRLNFSRNSNIGLRFAHKELKLPVLLVNMDCQLPAWEHLKKIPGKGLSTPYTTEEWKAAANTGARTPINNKFAFYCPFFNLDLLDEVGVLDPGLTVTWSDDDYIARALLAGFLVERVDIAIYHKGSHIDQNVNGGSLCGAYNGSNLQTDMHRYIMKWQINLQDSGMMIYDTITPQGRPNDSNFIPWILKKHYWTKEMSIV